MCDGKTTNDRRYVICNLQACVTPGQLLLLLGQLSHLVTVVTDGLVIDMDQDSDDNNHQRWPR